MHTSAKFVDREAASERGISITLIPNRIAKTTAEFTRPISAPPPGRPATRWRSPVENIDRLLDGFRLLDVLNREVYGDAATRDERIG